VDAYFFLLPLPLIFAVLEGVTLGAGIGTPLRYALQAAFRLLFCVATFYQNGV